MADTATTLPSYALWNGHATCLEISEPCWLYAGWLTDLDGDGHAWRFTYLSTLVQPQDKLYLRMLEWLDGALPIGEPQIITDPDMMFGAALLSLHELRPLDVTA